MMGLREIFNVNKQNADPFRDVRGPYAEWEERSRFQNVCAICGNSEMIHVPGVGHDFMGLKKPETKLKELDHG